MNMKDIKEFVQGFSNGTYDLTDNGKCKGCGECCSNMLPMTDNEIATIRNYIKVNRIKESKHYNGIPLANPILDMCCPFLNNNKTDKKCTIYKVRPRVCRDFICCPSKRPPLSEEWSRKAKPTNVRKIFYGGA